MAQDRMSRRLPQSKEEWDALNARIDERNQRRDNVLAGRLPEHRPPRVSDRDWHILQRVAQGGETMSAVARDTGLTPTRVRQIVYGAAYEVADEVHRAGRICPHCSGTGFIPE